MFHLKLLRRSDDSLYLGSALKVVHKISFWSTMVPLSLHFVYKLKMNISFLKHTLVGIPKSNTFITENDLQCGVPYGGHWRSLRSPAKTKTLLARHISTDEICWLLLHTSPQNIKAYKMLSLILGNVQWHILIWRLCHAEVYRMTLSSPLQQIKQ